MNPNLSLGVSDAVLAKEVLPRPDIPAMHSMLPGFGQLQARPRSEQSGRNPTAVPSKLLRTRLCMLPGRRGRSPARHGASHGSYSGLISWLATTWRASLSLLHRLRVAM